MGQKKKAAQGEGQQSLLRMMVPSDLLSFFELYAVEERSSEWQIILHEKEDLVPAALKDKKDVVLDGYCNPLHVLSHCFTLKPVYLVLKRRRWKQAGTDAHYSNEYTITENPCKLTDDMAGFLKI